MSIKVKPADYPDIIEVYNTEGKQAAYGYLKAHYGVMNPGCVLRRMKKEERTAYNSDTDRFECKTVKDDEIFMGLEDLCGHRIVRQESSGTDSIRINAMENMIHSLISDRLLEISRYVTLDPISHKILIDQTSMQADGYIVCVC